MLPLSIRPLRAPLALAVLVCGPFVPEARAQSLETFVMTVGGNSAGTGGCSTFLSPSPVMTHFGPHGPSMPLAGLGPCGVAGDARDAVSTSAPLFDALSLATSWNTGGVNTFTGDAYALAQHGELIVHAQSDLGFTSGFGGSLVVGSEAFAISTDALTIRSASVANGQIGYLRFYVTLSGGLSTSGNGTSDVELVYRAGAGPTYTLFRSQAYGLALPWVHSTTGNDVSGFVRTPGAMSGSGVFDTFVPFTFGAPLDFRLGLLAYGVPGATTVLLDGDFQARISGLQVLNASGQPLADGVVSSAAGARYGLLSGATSGTAGVPGRAVVHGASASAPSPAILLPILPWQILWARVVQELSR